GVVVALVFVVGAGAVGAAADHLRGGVRGEVGVARVVERGGEGARQAEAVVEPAEREQPRVAGQGGARGVAHDGQPAASEGRLPGRRYTRGWPPGESRTLVS